MGAAELGGQVGDALFAGLQGEQDGQPGGVGQDAEQAGGLPGRRGVGSQADRHAVTVAAAAAGGAGHVRGVRGGEGLDAGPGQGGQQRGAAAGRLPWLAGGGGLVELAAGVAFEAAELVAQRGWADAQAGGRGGDGGGGHGDLEPAQPVPACRAASGRAADVAGNLVAGLGGAAGAGGLPGEVVSGQRARAGRGGAADAGHGDAVLAGDPGEEPAGDPGFGFQLPEVLARGDVLAFEELAGQDGAGVLLPLPCRGRGGSAPLACGPGDVFEREPDVAGGGAQPGGRVGDGEPAGDDEVAGGVQVDVVRFRPGQGQAGAAAGRRYPGQRLADAQLVQESGGVAVQRVPQPGGEGAGEGVVVAGVVAGGERGGVPGVTLITCAERKSLP